MTDSERLVRVETLVEELVKELRGNGQPGRLDEIDNKVSALEKDSARTKGIYAGVSAVIAGFSYWWGR